MWLLNFAPLELTLLFFPVSNNISAPPGLFIANMEIRDDSFFIRITDSQWFAKNKSRKPLAIEYSITY